MPAAYRTGAILALDQGGQSSRAVVYEEDFCVVASSRRALDDRRPAPDRVEQDPEAVVASLVESAREALGAAARRGVAVTRAGLATQRSSIVCWDRRDGTPLSPVISWQDRRGAARLAALAPRAAEIHRRTGLVLSPHYGASKLAWCVDELPAVRAALDDGTLAFGPLASFLAFRLTRERAHLVDPANASRTQLVSLATGDWDDELLALFGVPRAPLPACVPTRCAWGTLIEAVTGSSQGDALPLTVVQGDQSAALFAFGEPRNDTLYLNLGTGAFLQRPADAALVDPAPLLASVVFADGEGARFVLEGTVNGAASAIEEVARQLGIDDPIAALPRWLDEVSDPPLFLNGVSGVGSPFWIPDLASRFVGEGDAHACMVAVVESIAFLIRANLDAFERHLPRARCIVATGGLSRLDGLCTRIASLAGTPLERPPALEATSAGLAWLVADDPAPQTEVTADVIEPRADAALERRFTRWSVEMHRAEHGSART